MCTTPIYKTAAELGIEQWEHDGLIALIGPLRRGELAYDQGSYVSTGHCGTAGCIGGWVAFFANKNSEDYVESRDDGGLLSALYWGCHTGLHYCPTTQQGADAIVNFLTLGEPRWDDVMREPADDIADFDADDIGAREHVVEGGAA